MSILSRFFGAKSPVVIRPFPANEGEIEIKRWFGDTTPWDIVHGNIIDALIEKLSGDKLIFEVFIIRSMENFFVREYVRLGESAESNSKEMCIPIISGMFARLGGNSANSLLKAMNEGTVTQKLMQKHYGLARDALEVAIALSSDQIMAYLALAQVLAMFGKEPEAADCATQGLAKISELKGKNIPFPPAMREGTDLLEIQLTELLAKLGTHQ